MFEIVSESHLDHGLSAAHIAFLRDRFADRTGFFAETVELPPGLADLFCALVGPAMGDPPVLTGTVEVRRRERHYPSRCVQQVARATRLVSVIAGPYHGKPCVLYTAFGGPIAPREPGDPSTPEHDRARSIEFWAVHALASGGVEKSSS